MAEFDWKKLVSQVAPTLGTMLLGPMGGVALTSLSNIFLGNPDGNEDAVAKAVASGMTPDKIAEMQKIDLEHKERAAQLGFDYAKLNQATTLAYIDDTQDARKYKDDKVFWLGVVVLGMFAIVMSMSLYGAYQMLQGGITIKDVSVVAALSGFVGSIIGYVSANAQQVIGYFYGSSAGSVEKTSAMAASMKDVLNTASK